MHAQLQEARKRLQAAQDAYVLAVRSLDTQYAKPLVGAGIEAEGVAALRSDYYITSGEVAELAEQDQPKLDPATASSVGPGETTGPVGPAVKPIRKRKKKQ
jgi:hypothetical protein